MNKPTTLYSQRLDLPDRHRQKTGCGPTGLLMLMVYWQKLGHHRRDNLPNLVKLHQVGLNRRAYKAGVGWSHTGLVGLAKLYGFRRSVSRDLAKESDRTAYVALKQTLKYSPVMASVYTNFIPGRGGHLVVLLSLSARQAILLDPDRSRRSEVYRIMPAEKFLRAWKKRFIIIRP